jgi:molybdate transport system substrate-binding protein
MDITLNGPIADRRSVLKGLAAWALAPAAVAAAEPHTVLVFAAASLTDALDEVGKGFTAGSHVPVKASYAASSVLAKQIEAGAPAEVFLSADEQWMDYLEQRQLLVPGTRRDLLGNSLVLVAPADSTVHITLAPHMDLLGALGPSGHLAMGDPSSVPAGIYGHQALEKLGVWSQVESRVAGAESVRAALALVARGEAPLGIVYRTDALADKKVRIVGEFPQDSHAPVRYPVALVKGAGSEASQLLQYLGQGAARDVFGRHGFTLA